MCGNGPFEPWGHAPEPELDRLSSILESFNEQFGYVELIVQYVANHIAPKVATDASYPNARANTPHHARLAHDEALAKAAQG